MILQNSRRECCLLGETNTALILTELSLPQAQLLRFVAANARHSNLDCAEDHTQRSRRCQTMALDISKDS